MVKKRKKSQKPKKKAPESIRQEDRSARRKYKRGGRIEAYTFGEALGSKRWP